MMNDINTWSAATYIFLFGFMALAFLAGVLVERRKAKNRAADGGVPKW